MDTAGKTATKTTGTTNASSSKKGSEKKEQSLECLFKKGLKAMYSAETQLVEALPEMAKAADNEELQDAINKHLEETKRHAERLEKIFSKLEIDKSGGSLSGNLRVSIKRTRFIRAPNQKGLQLVLRLVLGLG